MKEKEFTTYVLLNLIKSIPSDFPLRTAKMGSEMKCLNDDLQLQLHVLLQCLGHTNRGLYELITSRSNTTIYILNTISCPQSEQSFFAVHKSITVLHISIFKR